MKDEVSEIQAWRQASHLGRSHSTRRSRAKSMHKGLHQRRVPLEALDAFFDEVAQLDEPRGDAAAPPEKPEPQEIIQGITTQLALLESQKDQLLRLLNQAQAQQ